MKAIKVFTQNGHIDHNLTEMGTGLKPCDVIDVLFKNVCFSKHIIMSDFLTAVRCYEMIQFCTKIGCKIRFIHRGEDAFEYPGSKYFQLSDDDEETVYESLELLNQPCDENDSVFSIHADGVNTWVDMGCESLNSRHVKKRRCYSEAVFVNSISDNIFLCDMIDSFIFDNKKNCEPFVLSRDISNVSKKMLFFFAFFGDEKTMIETSIHDYYSHRFSPDWNNRKHFDLAVDNIVLRRDKTFTGECEIAFLMSDLAKRCMTYMMNVLDIRHREYVLHILDMQAVIIRNAICIYENVHKATLTCDTGALITRQSVIDAAYFECLKITHYYSKCNLAMNFTDFPKCCLIAFYVLLQVLDNGGFWLY